MATILLQAAGAFVGGLLGPAGSAIGAAAGALAGYAVDQALINGTRRIEGPRLSGARPFTAEEGASLARVYGTARIGGTLIWATRFEESRTTKRQGGKGGPRVTEYSYFANVAFALCEGEISGIRRIWADGRELDQTGLEIRVYRGGETQPADPLIEAKQGAGNAPAYRGVAYVVLEFRARAVRQPHSATPVRGAAPARRAAGANPRCLANPRSDRIRAFAGIGDAAEASRRERGAEPACAACRDRSGNVAR
jgi:hypothetical protein